MWPCLFSRDETHEILVGGNLLCCVFGSRQGTLAATVHVCVCELTEGKDGGREGPGILREPQLRHFGWDEKQEELGHPGEHLQKDNHIEMYLWGLLSLRGLGFCVIKAFEFNRNVHKIFPLLFCQPELPTCPPRQMAY